MQKINKKEVINYIKRHPLLLKDFDLNNDGFLDDYEINNIYAAVVEYISKKLTHNWHYSTPPNSEVYGPVNFASLPKSKNSYIRPEGSDLWLPYDIIKAARKYEFNQKDRLIDQVLLSTSDQIYGYNIIEHKGIVWGVTVRAKDFFTDFTASIQNFFGG
ncbi:MAG: YbjQ family protein, partial [Desulfobulbaceae bacterium]|nr:YbjQ family protein [Desulfobulbaceae bacterium]